MAWQNVSGEHTGTRHFVPSFYVPSFCHFRRSTAVEHLQQEEGRTAWETVFCTEHLSVVSGDPEEVNRRLAIAADELRRGGEGNAFAMELLSPGGVQTAVSADIKCRLRRGQPPTLYFKRVNAASVGTANVLNKRVSSTGSTCTRESERVPSLAHVV